jgi:hypothetical protein
MDKLLVVLSVVAVGIGFLFLSEATMGVGIIGIAATLGIWARLAQASSNHMEVLAQLESMREMLNKIDNATTYSAQAASNQAYNKEA